LLFSRTIFMAVHDNFLLYRKQNRASETMPEG